MLQASCLDDLTLYLLSMLQDLRRTALIGLGGCNLAEALMVMIVVVTIDGGGDLSLKITGQAISFEQDAVFQRLMPALDLASDLGVTPRAANMIDVFS